MRTLPVCIFTHNRTGVALATIEALLSNLQCTKRRIRYILCDDRSEPGHVKALVNAFEKYNIEPSVHLNDEKRWGLGASMNKGLEEAFSMSYECLRLEDDWLLKRPLDLHDWVESMDELSIGSVRLGMMFREKHELLPFANGLLRVKSDPGRTYTFNNQIALVSDAVYSLTGSYLENADPQKVEYDMAVKYNRITSNCNATPYVCWPEGWETKTYYGRNMAFDHIGASTLGHKFKVPVKYLDVNRPEIDGAIRARFA